MKSTTPVCALEEGRVKPADLPGPTVLVIDDDALIRCLARGALEPEGLRVEEACDGAAGLRAFERERPDIVLLDVNMPGMSGYECCERLRHLPEGIRLPIMMLTGQDDDASITRAFDAGATDFTAKPVNWKLLEQRVRYLLRGSETLERLTGSEALLRASFEQAGVGIAHIGADRQVVRANRKLAQMLGRPVDQIVGSRMRDLSHPQDREALTAGFARLDAGEIEHLVCEKRYLRGDGSAMWARVTVALARNAQGASQYEIAMLEDITSERHATAEMRRFRSALEVSFDAVYIVSRREMKIVDTNDAACRMLGYSREDLIGANPCILLADASITPERLAGSYDQFIATPSGHEVLEVLHRRKDGSPVPVEVQRSAIVIDGEQYIVGVARDIGERKRAERLLGLEHKVARGLTESASAVGGLRSAIRLICETENWEGGRYFEVDEKAGLLRVAESWHRTGSTLDRFMADSREVTFRRGEGLAGLVWQSGKPMWVADVKSDPRVSQRALAGIAGMRSAFVFPVVAQDQTIGVLATSSREVREPDPRFLQAMGAIGSLLGQFVQRMRAEEALRQSEERLRTLIAAQPECVKLVAPDGSLQDMNAAGLAMVEADSLEAVRGLSVLELVAPEYRDAYRALHQRVCGGQREVLQFEITGLRGTRRWMETHAVPFRAGPGAPVHQLAVTRDITERKRDERLLALEHSVTRCLAEADSASGGSRSAIRAICEAMDWEGGRYSSVDEKAGVLRFSEAWSRPDAALERFLAASRELTFARGCGLAGRVWQSGEPLWVSDINQDDRMVNKALALEPGLRGVFLFPVVSQGKTIGVLSTFSRRARDPDARLLQAVRVIGSQLGQFLQRKEAEHRMAHLAQFDPLTGLANRTLFRDRLEQALAQAHRNDWRVGLLLVDLDQFKRVNDTLGHALGDELLKEAGTRLLACLRAGDTVARLGGDEFAVVLPDLDSPEAAGVVAQKILDALKAPFGLAGQEVVVGASIGVTVYPSDAGDVETLLRNADVTMYRAKEAGRNGYQYFTPEMNVEAVRKLALEKDLRRALERGEFELHYQPKTEVDAARVTGVEALLRWRRPDNTLISPAEFIPVLEDTGLIAEVGDWVIGEACRQHAKWHSAGFKGLRVAVNVSARQFHGGRLVESVRQALAATGCPPQCLEIEITESLVMQDVEVTIEALDALRSMGVRVAVDDFGTGYSSLAYLKRLPIDVLKIDRSFVKDLSNDPNDAAIVIAIIAMARGLGYRVIAEGVETHLQRQFLEANGCHEIQGYLLSRPLPPARLAEWLAEHSLNHGEGAAHAGVSAT